MRLYTKLTDSTAGDLHAGTMYIYFLDSAEKSKDCILGSSRCRVPFFYFRGSRLMVILPRARTSIFNS
jgi:hypothetical protein